MATIPSVVPVDYLGKRRHVDENIFVAYKTFSISASLYGDKGLRKQMEDEHLMVQSMQQEFEAPANRNFSLFGIFDGHGGRQCASFVKQILPSEIVAQIKLYINDPEEMVDEDVVSDREMKKVVYESFKKMDTRIATELPACRDGCTAVCAFIREDQVFVVGLGDSAAYLARYEDDTLHAIPLTETHRPWVIGEKDRIIKMGGTIENGRVNGSLEVTRSFGDISLKRYGVSCLPCIRKFTLDPNLDRFIVLGCDGFWNSWTASEALQMTAQLIEKENRAAIAEHRQADLSRVCRQLVDYVLIDKRSQDNISVLVIQINKLI